MQFQVSLQFDPEHEANTFFESIPPGPAVFAIFPHESEGLKTAPYLSRSTDLRRRLIRLLGKPSPGSKRLSLRELASRIEYSRVGSGFEAQWLLYLLNKSYYPKLYRQRLRLKPPALLKLNLSNRFPRLYPARRISNDRSIYYGPFRSRAESERWASEFLDFFKIRRCVEDLNPDPAHPGCIYSQMNMCLAPCFAGCTDEQYQGEVGRVVAFLDAGGQSLVRALEGERAQAAESLEFEQAAKVHRRIEKVHEVLRQKPGLACNLRQFHALVVEQGAEGNSVVFFRVCAGELRGPATLCLDENVSSPVSLDEQLHNLLDSLAAEPGLAHKPAAPPWEHLSLLARWYYSSFRRGELVMLPADQQIPHARLIRICRKLLAAEG
ncbi:MAG TPA: UvrB/UvrC motif-containing protein [Terriglobia bacterium]|nr:UvrB/UvrC motif-containing protein [Terriglobia bacterium]